MRESFLANSPVTIIGGRGPLFKVCPKSGG
jgi:hypothetical protein